MATAHVLLRICAIAAGSAATILTAPQLHAQQITPSSNGFTIGTSSGQSSFYRQESKSEANGLLQRIQINTTPVDSQPGSSDVNPSYRIANPLEAFNLVNERQIQSAGSSTTSIGGATFRGFNFSVFSQ
jgi:hypothetical protein